MCNLKAEIGLIELSVLGILRPWCAKILLFVSRKPCLKSKRRQKTWTNFLNESTIWSVSLVSRNVSAIELQDQTRAGFIVFFSFKGIMKKQVDEMEVRVDQAEKDLEIGIGPSFKKVFTSFLPKRQNQVIVRLL